MNKICRRNGELPVTLEFAGVRVEMGLTEFRALLMCTLNDLPRASGPVRRAIEKPVGLLIEAADFLCAVSPPTTAADDAANLARYHATGIGGETDLQELAGVLVAWKKRLADGGHSTEAFNALRKQFADGGSRLIPESKMTEHDRIRWKRALACDRNNIESLHDAICGLQSTDAPELVALHDELQARASELAEQRPKEGA